MPRHRLPYLHKETSRHGKTVWTVRMGKGPRTRIRGEYGSPEFRAAYDAAIAGEPAPKPSNIDASSITWLVDRYRASAAWVKLAPATRAQREIYYRKLCKTAGSKPFAQVDRARIEDGRDRLRARPYAANDWLKAMRGLFGWAVENRHMRIDPTIGVKGLANRTDGFAPWTDDEIARFEAYWPTGTRERLALAILLYTGLRRGDAAALGPQHIKDGVISIATQKTGQMVVIPVLPELAAALAASPIGAQSLIARQDGKPMVKEGFGNWFRSACQAAKVPGSAHGLRKAGATRAANHGFTEAQLEAWYGWSGGRMAALYTRKANRVRLASEAAEKLK